MYTKLKLRYRYYKSFCKQVDLGEWVVNKRDWSSYNINGEGSAYYITNSRSGQQLWIANGFLSFSDYNYDRYDFQTINVFGLLKLAAWVKATPVIFKARMHNAKIIKLKIKRDREKAEAALLSIISND